MAPELRSVFNHQLSLLDAQLLVMGTAVEGSLQNTLEAMDTRDAEMAQRVIDGDDDIDRQERDIESLCLNILLTQQPVATDLRRVSAALKMVSDMERIADQAGDICETVLSVEGPLDAKLSKHIGRMGARSLEMVHNAIEAFVERDAEKAREVIVSDEGVDELFDKVKRDVVAAIQADADPAHNLVEALMVAKYLERIGDHAQNIAEWVEYSLTGLYKGEPIG